MLATVAALATTLLAQQPVDKATLELYQQRFVIRTANEVVRVPIRSILEEPPAVMFRRDDHYAVWDERGLTSRAGSWSFGTRLREFPTSSRFFKREEILQTVDLAKRGVRSLEASSVSGAKRLGNNAYFLVRWDDSSGKPWQEALVALALDGPKPKPRVIGRFEGLTLSSRSIDDKMSLRDGGLEVIAQAKDAWGVSRFDPKSEEFSFRGLGDKLQSYLSLSSAKGLFSESTAFGTCMVGEIDLGDGTRKLLYQGRGAARFVDKLTPRIIVATTPGGRILVNAATGAEVSIGSSDEVARAGKYVVTWSPSDSPKQARAFDPQRWTEIARWKAK
jgi:hypothetical protein